eukprot:TCONS_00069282-protein
MTLLHRTKTLVSNLFQTNNKNSHSTSSKHIHNNIINILGFKVSLLKITHTPPPGTKIRKSEYIDFDDILPPPPSTNNSTELLGFQLDANNNLLLKPNQTKAKIRDYPSWICAWNLYYQATLHYQPEMHFKLFSYFKIMATLARKHRFDCVYLYDKSQRQTLAAQHALPTDLCTASWTNINEELFNTYLRDKLLPSCFHFSSFGHFASSCPYKPNTRATMKQNPYVYVADKTFRNDNNALHHGPAPDKTTHHDSKITPLARNSASDITTMDPAIFLGADTPICAINVSPSATQDQGAKLHPQQPVHHSDLHPANPLPEGIVTPVHIKTFL